jgi:hypothetical protein
MRVVTGDGPAALYEAGESVENPGPVGRFIAFCEGFIEGVLELTGAGEEV